MSIKSKITAVHEDQGSIEVLWRDDASGLAFGPYNISIPLIDGQYPQGDELKKIIDGYTPIGEIYRLNQVKAAQGIATMSHIEALIGVEQDVDVNVFVTQACYA